MFTGIITTTAALTGSQKKKVGLTVSFQRPKAWSDLQLGESIATNGVCLTVAAIRADDYDCVLVPETLARTSFGRQLPKIVNLERSLGLSDRFGGHFVQGHVDGIGIVSGINKTDGFRLSVDFDAVSRELVIYKGSITINGVSLTVADVQENTFTVALVPHTLEHTTLGSLCQGDEVNLEFDMIGKYITNSIKNRGYSATS